MRTSPLRLLLISAIPLLGGCITYSADSPFLTRDAVIRQYDAELEDLRSARDQGAITAAEYEQQTSALRTAFHDGDVIITSRMTDEEADEFTKNLGESDEVSPFDSDFQLENVK